MGTTTVRYRAVFNLARLDILEETRDSVVLLGRQSYSA